MSRAVMVTNCTRRVEKNVSGATKRASGRLALKGGEGRIDLAARADVEDIDLQPDDVGRILHVPQVGRRGGTGEQGRGRAVMLYLARLSRPSRTLSGCSAVPKRKTREGIVGWEKERRRRYRGVGSPNRRQNNGASKSGYFVTSSRKMMNPGTWCLRMG